MQNSASELRAFFAKICSIQPDFCVSKTPLNIFAIRKLTFLRAEGLRLRHILSFYINNLSALAALNGSVKRMC